MSLETRSLSTIRTAIEGGLTSLTLTSGDWTVTLSLADDDMDPTVGPSECADGGFIVASTGGRQAQFGVPQTVGSRHQRRWAHGFRVIVAYRVEGITGSLRQDISDAVIEGVLAQIQATLEPVSGANYILDPSMAYSSPRRHPVRTSFYVQEFTFTVLNH